LGKNYNKTEQREREDGLAKLGQKERSADPTPSFSNIVTFAWWDNLWLNEAFATLIGEVIVIQEVRWLISSWLVTEQAGMANVRTSSSAD
jgi:hypothetical protein